MLELQQQELGMEAMEGHDELSESSSDERNKQSAVDEDLSSESGSSFVPCSSGSSSDDCSMLDCKKPTSHNIIIETNMLMETLESHCVCKECNGPVIASFKTTTIATKVILECKDEDCGFYYQSASP
jgi:hypothetical protein